MNILLTNDDNYLSIGLKALQDSLHKKHSITVCAPQNEMSGVGHAFTIDKPLSYTEQSNKENTIKRFALSGTPSDCVKFAIGKLCTKKPDLVISGINNGENTGISVIYSGTVAGAREANFFNVPSIAVSVCIPNFTDSYLKNVSDWIVSFVDMAFDDDNFIMDSSTCLNINFPNCDFSKIKGVKFTNQGVAAFDDNYKTKDGEDKDKYWIYGQKYPPSSSTDDDTFIAKNYITIVPLKLDLTNYKALDTLKEKEELFNSLSDIR